MRSYKGLTNPVSALISIHTDVKTFQERSLRSRDELTARCLTRSLAEDRAVIGGETPGMSQAVLEQDG
jgi:hypothetical protein